MTCNFQWAREPQMNKKVGRLARVRRGGRRVTSSKEAQAPLEQRDRRPKVDKRRMGWGTTNRYTCSHRWITLAVRETGATRGEGSPHLQGGRAMDD